MKDLALVIALFSNGMIGFSALNKNIYGCVCWLGCTVLMTGYYLAELIKQNKKD
jgi:hypothetical protein